jgi:glycerol uptake facilitator-like aquaporin
MLGAHFDPAVAFAMRRDLPWREARSYLVAQLAGGILGV